MVDRDYDNPAVYIAKLEAEKDQLEYAYRDKHSALVLLVEENQRLRDALKQIYLWEDNFDHIDDAAMFAKQALEDELTS